MRVSHTGPTVVSSRDREDGDGDERVERLTFDGKGRKCEVYKTRSYMSFFYLSELYYL